MNNMMNNETSIMNLNQRDFRRGTPNACAQTVRTGCGLAWLLAALAFAFLTPRVAMGALEVDVGTHTLIGNDATPQTIYLSIYNSGSPITVGALDFYIQLGDGTGSTPYISSVDLVSGTIFQGNNLGQSGQGIGSQLVYYGVAKASGTPGSGPQIPTGQSQLAAISFVTAGTASGSFSLSLNPSAGTTEYFTDSSSPAGIGLSFMAGTLDVVAVPEPSNTVAAVFMVFFAGFHALRQRWFRAVKQRPDSSHVTG